MYVTVTIQTVIALTSPSIKTTATIIGFHTSSNTRVLHFPLANIPFLYSCLSTTSINTRPLLFLPHSLGMRLEYNNIRNFSFGCNSVYPKCFIAVEIKATVRRSEWVTILVVWLVKLLDSGWLCQHSSRFQRTFTRCNVDSMLHPTCL